jgi:hypothetical protein
MTNPSTTLGSDFADTINDECAAAGADLRSAEEPMFGGASRHTWHLHGATIVITWPATDVP